MTKHLHFLIIAALLPLPLLAQPTRCDKVLTAAHVLTMDDSLRVFSPGAVAITGDKILAVGAPKDVLSIYAGRQVRDFGQTILMPGLINTHCHLPMILLRGMADDMELMDWLNGYIFPLEAKLVNAQFCYDATLVACAELIRRGVTGVADMYYFEDDVARAVKEAGMRGWLGETLIDFPSPDSKTPAECLIYTEKCVQKWSNDPLVKVVPAPHSTYTVSPDNLKACKALADKYKTLLITHLSESATEVETVRKQSGQTPTELAASVGLLGPTTIAAHCVVMTPHDMELLKASGAAVAHNPDSNIKLCCGLAPIAQMRKQGLRVGLGTDGPVSNNRLDVFDAMDLVAKEQKLCENDPTAMKAAEVVRLATLGGAEALGAADRLGSLEPGKQADLIVVDLQGANYGPVYDPYSHLVYTAHGEMVTSTMVAGKWLMLNNKLLTLSEKRLRQIVSHYQPLAKAAVSH